MALHRIAPRVALLLVICLALGGIALNPLLSLALNVPAKKDSAEAPQYTIIPGKGVEKCSLGMPVRCATDVFGKPDKEGSDYVHFYRQGVEAKVEDGKIASLFFHYRSRTAVTIDGETDKGIGMWSTIPQVLKRYGEPSRIGDSIVSEFGPMPGARDYTIEYTKIGISFTFYNNELAHITVYRPK